MGKIIIDILKPYTKHLIVAGGVAATAGAALVTKKILERRKARIEHEDIVIDYAEVEKRKGQCRGA